MATFRDVRGNTASAHCSPEGRTVIALVGIQFFEPPLRTGPQFTDGGLGTDEIMPIAAGQHVCERQPCFSVRREMLVPLR